MNSVVVAGLLKRVYKSFDMLTFGNRLKLQKYIYLMQALFKLNIGYEFSLYHHGPYSTELAKNGFQIQNFEEMKPLRFKDDEAEKRFSSFVNFIKPHKDDIEWLEIASSIHILKTLYPTENDEQIIKRVKEKCHEFISKEAKIRQIFLELRKGGFI